MAAFSGTERENNQRTYVSGYATCYDMFHMAVNLPFIHQKKKTYWEYSRAPLIRINWEGEPFGYAENPDNWIFLCKQATLAGWSGKKNLQTAILGYIFIYVQTKY